MSRRFCKLQCSEALAGLPVTEIIMRILQVSLVLITLFDGSLEKPFVFDDKVHTCRYSTTSVNSTEKIDMRSYTYSVTLEQIEVHYKLCGTFNNNICPTGTSACLRNHKSGNKIVLGKNFSFVSDKGYQFISVQGDFCTSSKNYSMVVNLDCAEDLKTDAVLISNEDKCTYLVRMRGPKCSIKCTTYIDGKFIDLRDLERSFSLTTADRNFSVSLCEKNSFCNGDDVNACEIIDGIQTPISFVSSISISYLGEKNQLIFHGASHQGESKKIDKRFSIILKCDWDKEDVTNEDLTYVKKQTQGKKYTFELKTSFGCIKKPVPCVVRDQFLIYNLSGLYNEHQGMWSAHGGPEISDSMYFLQMCGPVELAGKNTSCKSTYAQVCENRNGIDINRGSVFRRLQVVNDVLKATIESGMHCKKNPDLQYKTLIDFYCEEHEQGPKFVKQTNCDTYFTWKTPHACPEYIISSCSHVHEKHHSCLFQEGSSYYNLTELTKTEKSIRMKNELILLNICGPVLDPDAPCMKDVSIVLKDLTEFNKKHRVISLGKFSGMSMEKDNLVIEYATGSFCVGTDYRSKIIFECSILQEGPKIIRRDKCYFEFLWKTKYACRSQIGETVKLIHDTKNCTYVDNYSNKRIDFGSLEPSSIHLQDIGYRYAFDICQNNYTNCTENMDDCVYVPIEKTAFSILDDFTSLEFILPIECVGGDGFNKVNFRFICDQIKNNDHVGSLDIINCTLVIKYLTHKVCSLEKEYVHIGHNNQPDHSIISKSGTSSREIPVQTASKCSSRSPFTNQELNLSNITLKNAFFKKTCPMVTFNDTYGFVKLLYVTTDICEPVPTKNLSYEVYLMCPKDKVLPSEDNECLLRYNYEEPEYCNYFKSQYLLSSGSIIGIVIGILLVIGVASIITCIALKNKFCRNREYNGLLGIYVKGPCMLVS